MAYQDSVEDESEEVLQKLDDLTRLDQAPTRTDLTTGTVLEKSRLEHDKP